MEDSSPYLLEDRSSPRSKGLERRQVENNQESHGYVDVYN